MNRSVPILTVFMPAYNAAAYLAEAIESVLGQTNGDFEFLVIDDGSTDATPQLLQRYALKDRRLRIVRHSRNRGLAFSFAHGYALAKSRFIARMDADDICEPERLARQLNYFQANPSTAVLGTWLKLFGTKSAVLRLPWLHDDILCESIFQNPIAHPSAMLDRERLPGIPDFRHAYQPADDYDLWSRWLRKGLRFAALPEPWLRYRMHAAQASRTEAMEVGAWRVRHDWLKVMKLRVDRREAALHQKLCLGAGDRRDALAIEAWTARLERAGLEYGLPPIAWRYRLRSLPAQAMDRLQRIIHRATAGPAMWGWDLRRTMTRVQA